MAMNERLYFRRLLQFQVKGVRLSNNPCHEICRWYLPVWLRCMRGGIEACRTAQGAALEAQD
jgi:hypothetical protein